MRVSLAQINTTVGDLAGNVSRILAAVASAESAGADLVLFPELAICGYPPLDLVGRSDFVRAVERATEELAGQLVGKPVVVVGTVRPSPPGSARNVHNSTAVIEDGNIIGYADKILLPTYDVFDEARTFEPGREVRLFELAGQKVGISICEDLWTDEVPGQPLYQRDPGQELVEQGAEIILSPSASPFQRGRSGVRQQMFIDQSRRFGIPIALSNLVGGNTELIFDGSSLLAQPDGTLDLLPSFVEEIRIVGESVTETKQDHEGIEVDEIAGAIVLGIRDYFRKCGIEKAVIGLSGGIDSAVTALLAVEALGADQVSGFGMPGPYSSAGSVDDARELADRLGIKFELVSTVETYQTIRQSLEPLLGQEDWGIAQENLQARIRGTILMTIANREGAMVLATGNKSELSVGYCTLYGDMCGGLAPLGDVSKRDVYAIAVLDRFAGRIPPATLEKPPSAELAPDQRDEDSLPPYDQLDAILKSWVEDRQSITEIQQQGNPPAVIEKVIGMIELSEHKRRQSPPILRISSKAFGIGRRVPIARSLDGWQFDDFDQTLPSPN
ncbi:MAG: NAD+ synthase [Planctomycetota bacterium]|nr:NAD+ synthase [Planctomycetota bacterium]